MSLFLFGQQPHGIRFSREITCGLGALTLFTGVLCVIVVGRQWIICCYIVKRLIGCGVFSLEFLGFHRFYHVRWQIFYLVGEAVISHLEFSSVVFDVVYLEGTQLANF